MQTVAVAAAAGPGRQRNKPRDEGAAPEVLATALPGKLQEGGVRHVHGNDGAPRRRELGQAAGANVRREFEAGTIPARPGAGYQDRRLLGCHGRGRRRAAHSVAARGPPGRG